MLIENTTSAPWVIGHPNPELSKGRMKKGEKISTELTVCVPGINRIDDSFWNEIKDWEDVKNKIKERKIFIITEKEGDKKEADKQQISKDFLGMDEIKAVEIIERTLNKKLLDNWSRTDNRARIQRAVNDQLDKLKVKR